MKVSVKIHNDWRLIDKKLSGKVADRLNVAAFNTESEAKESMKPGTGRLYKKGNVTHRASEAGKPPAVDTGRLRDSIRIIKYASVNDLQSRVGTNLKYAPYLEYGTKNMAARPFWNPAINKARAKLIAQLKQIAL
jgi:HK97 gp10 family phage protein